MTLEDEVERRDPPPQVAADSPPPLHLGPAAPGPPSLNNRPPVSLAQPTQQHNRNTRATADEHNSPTTEERDSQQAQAHHQSQHGPVAVSIAPENPGSCPPPQQPRPPVGTRARPALRTQIPEPWAGRPAGPPGKRHSVSENSAAPPLGSPLKKPRLIAPGSLPLPPPDPTANARSLVTSPLFFSSSSSPRHPISRPPSVPGPAIGLSMMGENEHPDGVTTLRLPKGQVSAASPARSSGTPRSWSSTELSSMSRSPDSWPQPSIIQLLQGIGMVELLELDERPTCIIDLNDQANSAPVPLHLVYANAALRTAPALLELLQADPADPGLSPDFPAFKTWVVSGRERSVSSAGTPSITYSGIVWTCTTLRRRFRIIRAYQDAAFDASAVSSQATESLPSAEPESASPWTDQGSDARRERERSDYFGPTSSSPSQQRSHSEPRSRADSTAETVVRPFDDLVLATPSPRLRTTFDWTQIPIDDPNLSAHHRFARSIDWAATPLGPVESWPLELRIMSSMIMGSPHPAALYWGKDYVAIYNEAYLSLAAGKHPRLMGQRYQDAWPEIWDEIRPVFDAAWNSGYATMKHDDSLYVSRHGFVEETFFNWAIIPLVGGDGTVVALYNPAFENTRRKISERRMLTLREVGIATAQARDVKGFWSQLQRGLEYNERDVPFALIYSVAEDSESEVSSLASGNLAYPPAVHLAGSIGVPDGHPCAATSIDLRTSDEGFAPYMRESMAHPANPVVLSEADGTFPTELTRGLAWRGFGQPCHSIVVFPVHPTTAGDAVVGFIILGINPRRRYDEDYQLFINLLSRQLATSLASVVLFEEEIRRGQKAARLAALDRQELSLQLRLRTQEAVESEYRFTRMAEFGPVGLFIADNRGHIDYCNEMWYRISGLQRNASTFTAWMQSIRDEDRPDTERAWRRLVEDKVAITHEFRFKGSRELIDGHMVDVWALMSAYPERDEYGLKSIFGCITDISQQKWAEDVQKQRREEAVELKRQQENFIDITSHEMRNPLSAILQCADEISAGLSQYKLEDPVVHTPGALNLLIDSCVEAANIISLCANHQKRIVDDILTLSKLDSNLLLVTPVDVQPVVVVQDVLKMFETELHSNGIDSRLTIEQSYHELGVDWVKLDPSRLRQVLINLMTNAIKFTQGRPTRSIEITLGASKDIVLEETGFSYVPLQQPVQDDLTDDADWADGEKINLHLAVADTGSGLDEHEKQLLFQRFSQTSPRTHVQYGGSGLGLFICRILTELQGGQIAVQSEKGQGSTFAFYIKGRKSDHAQIESPVRTPVPRDIPPFSSPMRAAAAPTTAEQPTPGSVIIASPTDESTNALANASINETAAQPLPSPASGQQPGAGGPCRLDVLIVEDNLVNQKVLNRQLQLSGNNTYVANHGGEALAQLRRSRFWNSSALVQSDASAVTAAATATSGTAGEGTEMDVDGDGDVDQAVNISVILMDLEMPVMDGITCTREIRRLERAGVITQHIPIIAVTAYARPEQVESFKAAGVDDVISKPFRISELIPKIEELVHKYNVLPTP